MNYKNIKPYPGYEEHVNNITGYKGEKLSMKELQNAIRAYQLGEGTTMSDFYIDTPHGRHLKMHMIQPKECKENAPIVLDIHGGGWVSGDVDIDNYRNIYIAEHTPCIVVAVEYTLASKDIHFPIPLEDCLDAYLWLKENGSTIGGDQENIAIMGTSAGANISAGLLLYLRDHHYPMPKLTVLNCGVYTFDSTSSKEAFGKVGNNSNAPEYIYANTTSRDDVSYYVMPAYCEDLSNLSPVSIICAEYDFLRDDSIDFAYRLLKAQVPTELYMAPRVSHGYCSVQGNLTEYTHNGICASLRREFGKKIGKI